MATLSACDTILTRLDDDNKLTKAEIILIEAIVSAYETRLEKSMDVPDLSDAVAAPLVAAGSLLPLPEAPLLPDAAETDAATTAAPKPAPKPVLAGFGQPAQPSPFMTKVQQMWPKERVEAQPRPVGFERRFVPDEDTTTTASPPSDPGAGAAAADSPGKSAAAIARESALCALNGEL